MKSKINNFFEYFPFLINKKLSFFLSQIGDLESLLINQNDLKIEKPIFICGLARSGTTAVLNLLNNHSETGSFENQDLPFIKTLFLNKINTLFYKGLKQKRAEYMVMVYWLINIALRSLGRNNLERFLEEISLILVFLIF